MRVGRHPSTVGLGGQGWGEWSSRRLLEPGDSDRRRRRSRTETPTEPPELQKTGTSGRSRRALRKLRALTPSGQPSPTHGRSRPTPNARMAATATELEAILVNSGMAAGEAAKAAAACADATIGVTTIVSVLGYAASGLSSPGTAEFTATVRRLITAVKTKDPGALGTNALEGQFVTAVRKCAIEAANQEREQLLAIGLGSAPSTTAIVVGNEGEAVMKKEEIEKRRKLDASIGGYWHVTDATPSSKMVSFFAKGFAETPPVLRLFPLGSACTDFNARQHRKAPTAAEKLTGGDDSPYDLKGEKPTTKNKVTHSLILVGNAIAIAGAHVIPTAQLADYIDTDSGRVQIAGATQVVYCTRHVAERLLLTALVEGASSSAEQLIAGYEAVMKTAGQYIAAGYIAQTAFTKALHEERTEWRTPRVNDAAKPGDKRKGPPGNKQNQATSEKKRQIDAARTEAKRVCGDYNRNTCTRANCIYAHKCSAVIERNGKFEMCGDDKHTRTQHVAMARAGTAPAVIG